MQTHIHTPSPPSHRSFCLLVFGAAFSRPGHSRGETLGSLLLFSFWIVSFLGFPSRILTFSHTFLLCNDEAHTWSLRGLSGALVLQSQGLNVFCNLHERSERMLWSSFSFRATEAKASGARPNGTQLTDFEMDLLHHTHSWKLVFLSETCLSSLRAFASHPIGSSFFLTLVFFIQAPVMSNPSSTSDTCFDPVTSCSLWALWESFGCCEAQWSLGLLCFLSLSRSILSSLLFCLIHIFFMIFFFEVLLCFFVHKALSPFSLLRWPVASFSLLHFSAPLSALHFFFCVLTRTHLFHPLFFDLPGLSLLDSIVGFLKGCVPSYYSSSELILLEQTCGFPLLNPKTQSDRPFLSFTHYWCFRNEF